METVTQQQVDDYARDWDHLAFMSCDVEFDIALDLAGPWVTEAKRQPRPSRDSLEVAIVISRWQMIRRLTYS